MPLISWNEAWANSSQTSVCAVSDDWREIERSPVFKVTHASWKDFLFFCTPDVDRALQLKFMLPKRKQLDGINCTYLTEHVWIMILTPHMSRLIKKVLGHLSGTTTWAHEPTPLKSSVKLTRVRAVLFLWRNLASKTSKFNIPHFLSLMNNLKAHFIIYNRATQTCVQFGVSKKQQKTH